MSDHPVLRYISGSTWAFIEPHFTPYGIQKLSDLIDFVEAECLPAEHLYEAQISTDPAKRWKSTPPIMEELKEKAKKRNLWNLWMSQRHYPEGQPLSNLEYAVMAEILGRVPTIAPQACNSSAPDTGNMECFAKYGTVAQKEQYLKPLMEGKIRSSFAMTEYGVASSDATNIKTSIRKEGNEIVISGHKWWISGSGDPRNGVHLVMGKSDPTNPNPYKQQSVVIVPGNHPNIKLIRPMTLFGYDDAPEGHFEIIYDNVRVPESNLLAGWGRGFEVVQGRLGPGRIHHCMRTIGLAARSLDLMIARVSDPNRRTFGKMLKEHGTIVKDIAQSRIEIDQARLLVLSAAHKIDISDAKGAMRDIGLAKVQAPNMALRVIDRAMQAFGAEGISQDQPLAQFWTHARMIRYADGPDEVHLQQIGRGELKRADGIRAHLEKTAEKRKALMQRSKL